MRRLNIILTISVLASLILNAHLGLAVEPSMDDYTCYPIFQVSTVEPNILIILDNSGSMNFSAYGTWQGNKGTVTDSPYSGEPFCGVKEFRVFHSHDDAEEKVSNGAMRPDSSDLELIDDSGNQIVGIRFQNVQVPQGVTISSAYIEFETDETDSTATSLTIYGQDIDNAPQFSSTAYDISSRTDTTASVAWNDIPSWDTVNEKHQTPDLKAIVGEIVNRDGWSSGNAMVFKITGSGRRRAKSYDGERSAAPLLHVEYTPAECTKYYGYFDPDARYTYSSNRFERDPNGEWNGNWLNWLSMRRIDVARKVLVGGLAAPRGGENATLVGDDHNTQPKRFWRRWFDTSETTPYVSLYHGNYCYVIKGGYIYVDDDSDLSNGYIDRYTIKVLKSEADEPADFLDGSLAGILQRVGDKARFGLEFYNDSEGGDILSRVDSGNMNDIINKIENKKADTWTPLAEAFYEGVRYFKQVAPYYSNGDYTRNNTWDPYYWNDLHDFVECGKSFILLITDGESTYDKNIPSDLKDYDGDGNDPGTYGDNGSDYLDDVALWAHIDDLRSDLDGDQTIIFYPVFAFGQGSQLLKDAARNGGFIDKNGNNRPDLDEEWDANGDGIPDTYYESESGYELEAKLLKAITDILERAAAGTAVSVLATSGEGEGNLVQAYFRPSVPSGLTEVQWVGYLQSLWVDTYGNLREDTVHDLALDVGQDKVITYFLDTATGETKIKRLDVSEENSYPDAESDPYEVLELDEISPLWEAGSVLAQRSPDDRKIFTYIDKDQDGVVDDGEVVRFHTSSDSDIKPYLGVKDNSTWGYLGAAHDDRVTNLIQYIRGNDIIPGLRTRTIDGNVWKLGDIVHSTPVSISKPPDNFHTIYSDESYQDYYNEFKDRETMVYVGANDGMLHAFTSWEYNAADKEYTQPTGTTENIGDELWAYIPQSLLPHLKWLPSPDYTHVYYVDLKPKIFDAKILPDDTHYTDDDAEDDWGTILLIGLNMGGKHIQAEGDFNGDGTDTDTRDFYPSYACIDVTDPRNPRLLWDRTYTDLEMTTSTPAIVRVKDKWFAVFGSGPGNCDGTSTKKGHIFVVDLKTGDPYGSGGNDWLFETNESDAFMNSPISLDKNLNYNVDAIYFGETYSASNEWKGKLYKVTVPWVGTEGELYGHLDEDSYYVENPLEWKFSTLFDATSPITSPVALSVDTFNNVWVYAGSGRYLSTEDKDNRDKQYMFGIKDPFFNIEHTPDGLHEDDYYHKYNTSLELQISHLLDADPYIITEDGEVFKDSTSIGYWEDLLDLAQQKDGWIRTLTISKERILSKPSILGGIVFTTSYVPNEDICGFGGDSYLYGLYYETGTAFYEPVFKAETTTIEIQAQEMEKVVDKIELGSGKASSLGIQVGMEEGAKGFIQQSTGTIVSETINPAFNIKSGLRSWREK